jgi:flagellar basal body-associated protein FliL
MPPGPPGVPPGPPGVPAEATTGISSTEFCYICAEPTPSDQLEYDVDGNKICKQCIKSGGRKKSAKTRRIEAMKAQFEGKTHTTYTDRRGAANAPVLTMNKDMKAEPKKGSLGIVLVVVLLLVGAAAAAGYYFVVHEDRFGLMKGSGSGGGNRALIPDDGPKEKGEEPDEGPTKTPERKAPPTPTKTYEPVTYLGTFTGQHGHNGRLSGALIFESPTQGIVFVVLPKGSGRMAKTFDKGKSYKFTFKPDDEFDLSRRVTLSMLDGPIQKAD